MAIGRGAHAGDDGLVAVRDDDSGSVLTTEEVDDDDDDDEAGDDGGGVATHVTLIERSAERCAELAATWAGRPVNLVTAESVTDAAIDGASGLILAAFQPGRRAPELVEVEALGRMATGGAIVDVAVDEGGSIAGPKETMPAAIAMTFFRAPASSTPTRSAPA